jgi:hypothetical protein
VKEIWMIADTLDALTPLSGSAPVLAVKAQILRGNDQNPYGPGPAPCLVFECVGLGRAPLGARCERDPNAVRGPPTAVRISKVTSTKNRNFSNDVTANLKQWDLMSPDNGVIVPIIEQSSRLARQRSGRHCHGRSVAMCWPASLRMPALKSKSRFGRNGDADLNAGRGEFSRESFEREHIDGGARYGDNEGIGNRTGAAGLFVQQVAVTGNSGTDPRGQRISLIGIGEGGQHFGTGWNGSHELIMNTCAGISIT